MGRRTEDGLRMRVGGVTPQRERERQYQPAGGDFVGVMSSSPFVFYNARPLPTQPLSSSISPRT